MKEVVPVIVLLCSMHTIQCQQNNPKSILVRGTVKNFHMEPVKKATIFVDSVKTKIRTDKKGQFTIGLKPNSKVISVYSWKYGIQDFTYDGREYIQIVFPQDNNILSEQDLEAMGYDISRKIRKNKQPKDFSKYLNMYQMIAAEVPGAMVNGTIIRLRGNGVNSVQAGQDPLLIVDGTVVSSLEHIFPREVASVKVLRDEEATVYGTRGANGVIIINMK